MKAIYITRIGGPEVLEIREAEIPEPQAGEVLIRVGAFGLNFADALGRMGIYPDAPPFPFIPGYEVAGVVEKAGEGVVDFKKGDRVFGLTRFGGYAEYAIAPSVGMFPTFPEMSDEEAAAIPVNAMTAYLALVERGNIHSEERVLIHAACGGVGLWAIQIAKEKKTTLFATAGSESKCQFLAERGVHHPINYQKENFEARVMELTGGEGVDLVLDSIGSDSFKKSYRVLRDHGRLVGIGVASMVSGFTRSIPHVLLQFLKTPWFRALKLIREDKSFIGLNLKRFADHRPYLLHSIAQDVYNLIVQKNLKPTISQVFSMNEIKEAHRALQSRDRIGKIVVTTK